MDEEPFLEELMSLQRETPADLWHAYPSGGLMIGDLLLGGDARSMEVSPLQALPVPLPPPPAPATTTMHEEISFDCLSEVCIPYMNGAVRTDAPQMAINLPVHEAAVAVVEEERCEVRHGGGGAGDGSPMFVFGGVGAAGSENAMDGAAASVHPKSRLPGAPSKNLMAERRRRKRLNDRLSMLRAIVPKISKMDRTSILGDTIDYVKELMDRIKTIQDEVGAFSSEDLNTLSALTLTAASSIAAGKETTLTRNPSPTRFDVERRENGRTRVEIACAANPGLLPSTLSALEVLGMEIEQCVVSCFGDFAMQASCLQDDEKMETTNSEEIRQSLFKSAGYGGLLNGN